MFHETIVCSWRHCESCIVHSPENGRNRAVHLGEINLFNLNCFAVEFFNSRVLGPRKIGEACCLGANHVGQSHSPPGMADQCAAREASMRPWFTLDLPLLQKFLPTVRLQKDEPSEKIQRLLHEMVAGSQHGKTSNKERLPAMWQSHLVKHEIVAMIGRNKLVRIPCRSIEDEIYTGYRCWNYHRDLFSTIIEPSSPITLGTTLSHVHSRVAFWKLNKDTGRSAGHR